jgi:DNA adenine methylase
MVTANGQSDATSAGKWMQSEQGTINNTNCTNNMYCTCKNMVQYCGGKSKIGKQIANVMREYTGLKRFDVYIEPFCGMCGVMRHVEANDRQASDVFEDLIELWQALQGGYIPPTDHITKEHYQLQKYGPLGVERTFVGFAASYMGVYYTTYGAKVRQDVQRRSLLQLAQECADVKFRCVDYTQLRPHGSVIYCDPPYKCHKGKFKGFDHAQFWDTMREWSRDNIVFVSETEAPAEWQCIWKKEVRNSKKRWYY